MRTQPESPPQPSPDRSYTSAESETRGPKDRLRVIERDGREVPYNEAKIKAAIARAFRSAEDGAAAASMRVHEIVDKLTGQVTDTFMRRMPSGGAIPIENLQDQVELVLIRAGEHSAAHAYLLQREAATGENGSQAAGQPADSDRPETIELSIDGSEKVSVSMALLEALVEEACEGRDDISARVMLDDILQVLYAGVTLKAEKAATGTADADSGAAPLDLGRLESIVREACEGLEGVSVDAVFDEALKNLYDGFSTEEVDNTLVSSAHALMEKAPGYSYVAARLLLNKQRSEALSFLGIAPSATQRDMETLYARALPAYIERSVELGLLTPALGDFDLDLLGRSLKPERDLQFDYPGLRTLYDHHFLHSGEVCFELPQCFFMRMAMSAVMGLASADEKRQKNARAVEFYDLLSSFDYMDAMPTLFELRTERPPAAGTAGVPTAEQGPDQTAAPRKRL